MMKEIRNGHPIMEPQNFNAFDSYETSNSTQNNHLAHQTVRALGGVTPATWCIICLITLVFATYNRAISSAAKRKLFFIGTMVSIKMVARVHSFALFLIEIIILLLGT